MATKILDLDLLRLPSEPTGLAGYDHAFALIRLGQRPVGQALLPVSDGRLDAAPLRRALIDAAGWPVFEAWLADHLDGGAATQPARAPEAATIAICTRDRTEDLRRCLDGLANLPDDGQEILVVDNAPSTDATQRLVEAFANVRYVRTNRPGLDCARNRALREAKHPLVAFIDDDAAPDPGWLRALLTPFEDPLVMCVTGLTLPLELETESQELFERITGFSRRGYTRRMFDGATHNPLSTGPVGAGVNMALRRDVVERVGMFDEALDAGTPTHSGGDHEMFARILSAGYRIVYDPAALNWHRHRRTWQELHRAIFGYGVGVYASWTSSLIVRKEVGVLRLAYLWFVYEQAPALFRALRRHPDSSPPSLAFAELQGCAWGPFAYLQARKQLRKRRDQDLASGG